MIGEVGEENCFKRRKLFMEKCKSEENKSYCNCSYEPCARKGICCECIKYHLRLNEFPACFFPSDVEKTYDRSIEKFIEIYQDKKKQ